MVKSFTKRFYVWIMPVTKYHLSRDNSHPKWRINVDHPSWVNFFLSIFLKIFYDRIEERSAKGVLSQSTQCGGHDTFLFGSRIGIRCESPSNFNAIFSSFFTSGQGRPVTMGTILLNFYNKIKNTAISMAHRVADLNPDLVDSMQFDTINVCKPRKILNWFFCKKMNKLKFHANKY